MSFDALKDDVYVLIWPGNQSSALALVPYVCVVGSIFTAHGPVSGQVQVYEDFLFLPVSVVSNRGMFLMIVFFFHNWSAPLRKCPSRLPIGAIPGPAGAVRCSARRAVCFGPKGPCVF